MSRGQAGSPAAQQRPRPWGPCTLTGVSGQPRSDADLQHFVAGLEDGEDHVSRNENALKNRVALLMVCIGMGISALQLRGTESSAGDKNALGRRFSLRVSW